MNRFRRLPWGWLVLLVIAVLVGGTCFGGDDEAVQAAEARAEDARARLDSVTAKAVADSIEARRQMDSLAVVVSDSAEAARTHEERATAAGNRASSLSRRLSAALAASGDTVGAAMADSAAAECEAAVLSCEQAGAANREALAASEESLNNAERIMAGQSDRLRAAAVLDSARVNHIAELEKGRGFKFPIFGRVKATCGVMGGIVVPVPANGVPIGVVVGCGLVKG